jgi:hypothetical protein
VIASQSIPALIDHLRFDNLSFIYRAHFSDELTSLLIDLCEQNIGHVEELKKSRKKVSFLMAESFQNIIRHKKKRSRSKELFSLRNIGQEFYITSVNQVDNSAVPLLEEKLKTINQLNEEELKAFYMEVLTGGELSEKGGAGIGLIEMARRTGNPLEYRIDPYKENSSVFYKNLKFKGQADDENDHTVSVDDMANVQQLMEKEGILLVYKSDYRYKSIVPMLGVLKKSLTRLDEEARQKKVFVIAVELMQNITRHAKITERGCEGTLMIGQKGGVISVISGNYLNTIEANDLKAHLDRINESSTAELNDFYRETVHANSGTVKVGLIDVVRLSGATFEYQFTEVDATTSYGIIEVQI